MKVPFMDLSGCYNDIRPEIDEKISKLIENTAFIGGHEVSNFEKEFAEFQEAKFCSACSNGTDALILALRSLDIEPGDTVLIPANTFIATAEAVVAIGAVPDFIDVDKETFTLSAHNLDNYLSTHKRPACIIPVHLYGCIADMPAIMDIANKYDIRVIEDAAQAHGAHRFGKKAGAYGDLATFSFYPGKNLGAFGDAGAVITNDSTLHEKVSMLIDHGRKKEKYMHYASGYNKRMDSIQAAVLRIKLRYLEKWTNERIDKAQFYTEQLSDYGQCPPSEYEGHVYHIYAFHADKRNALKEYLDRNDVKSGIHYPIPLHLQPAFSHMGYSEGDFPNSEYNAFNELSLPLWPEISREQQEYVVKKIIEVLSE